MVKSDDLADQLGPLWHQTLVNRSVNSLESEPKRLFHVADAMQLGVMGTHHCAVVTKELFTGVAEVT